MKRKIRVFYEIEVPGCWYIPKLKKWVSEIETNNYQYYDKTNIQQFKNCKYKNKNWPSGTIIYKTFWKGNKRLIKMYEWI